MKWAKPAAGSLDDNLVSWIKEPSARGKFATYNFNERTTKQRFGQRDEKRLDFFHSAIISPERSSPRRPPPQWGRGRIQNPLIGQRKQAARWKGRMGVKDQKKGSELVPYSESLAAIKGVVSLRPWRSWRRVHASPATQTELPRQLPSSCWPKKNPCIISHYRTLCPKPAHIYQQPTHYTPLADKNTHFYLVQLPSNRWDIFATRAAWILWKTDLTVEKCWSQHVVFRFFFFSSRV